MRIFILLSIVTATALPIERGGFGGLTINLAMPDVVDLNSHFKANNIPEVSGKLIGLGGRGFALVDRIVIGGSGYCAKEFAESDSIRSELSISAGEFKIGYGLITSRFFNGIVDIGFGRVGYRLSLRPLLGDVHFDDLLKNPRRYCDLEAGHFLIHPEAMAVFSLPFRPISFFHIAVTGGANLNIFTEEWTYDQKRVLNAPEISLLTPVFSVNFLFGGGL